MLSEIQFGSFLSYKPRAYRGSDAEKLALTWRHRLKDNLMVTPKGGKPVSTAQFIAKNLSEFIQKNPDDEVSLLFDGDCTLIPVPRSSKTKAGSLWPALMISEAMVEQGLGTNVSRSLIRATSLPSSSKATGQRVTASNKYESLQYTPSLDERERLVIVDDFITQGSEMIAAVSRVQEGANPESAIGFAMMRTMGLPSTPFEQVLAPCMGTVTLQPSGWITRAP